MSREKAREQMRECAGNKFDPKLVSVFLKNLAAFDAELEEQSLEYDPTESNFASTLERSAGNYVEQIKLANKEVVTLFELAREFGACESLEEMLSLFTIKIRELVPFDTCAVYLLDDSKQYANAAHVEGDNCELLLSKRIKAGEGATGFALKKLEPVKNVNPDLDFSVSHLELIQQYSTMAAVPLMAEDALLGAVSVYANDLACYEEEHIRLLVAISTIAADAISKSRQHAEAKAHALTDPMTGLPNARSLQLQFNKEVGRTARSGMSFQVLVLDLDGFKAVNDTFGHKVGDEMLRGVSRVLQEQLRDYDFLARYGGDEFVALIPEADQKIVAEVCFRIEKAVAGFRLTIDEDRYASVGVSVGAASYPAHGQTFDQMVVAADKAMYVRKTKRKQSQTLAKQTATAPLSELLAQASEYDLSTLEFNEKPTGEGLIVELDESAVLASAAVN
jgi:diguanylate cyclase (GGDEF)-like protein